MKILFSPSEDKKYIQVFQGGEMSLDCREIYDVYREFLKGADLLELSQITGYQKEKDVLDFLFKVENCALSQAIELYDGVAYSALDFASLQERERGFVRENVLIFSNLFGVVRADAFLPYYKLKQGEGFGEFRTKTLYMQQLEHNRALIEGDFVVDLRAEFYKKLYEVQTHYFDFEFLKEGKKVSHYAKYYRGIVLRAIAQYQEIERIGEVLEEYELKSLGSRESKKKTTLIFAIS